MTLHVKLTSNEQLTASNWNRLAKELEKLDGLIKQKKPPDRKEVQFCVTNRKRKIKIKKTHDRIMR